MRRFWPPPGAVLAVMLLLQPCVQAEASPAYAAPKVGPEKLVLRTAAGDIVLAFYPEAAPRHVAQILALGQNGIFDTTHFYRVIPNFVMQTSFAGERLKPLTPDQRRLIKKIPAELSSLKHEKWTLSMARGESDINSATTSFSILLAKAPHLDGKYTIFGRVESGFEVIAELLKVPITTSGRPTTRLTIEKAMVASSPAALANVGLQGPSRLVPKPNIPEKIVAGLIVMTFVSLLTLFCAKKISRRALISLHLVNVLIGGFFIFAALAPVAPTNVWVASALIVGVVGLFLVMSKFESY